MTALRDRRAGVLAHPTTLAGPYGIGDVGPSARSLLGWLEAAGQRVWQMLPLHPVHRSGSPYASPSAFAGEPLLLSIDDLVADKLLGSGDKPYAPDTGRGWVDWAEVRSRKGPALVVAADRVRREVDVGRWAADRPELLDWSLFQAVAGEHGEDWFSWPEALRDRDARALGAVRDRLADEIERALALQWLFDRQWARLRDEAKGRGIELWGDVPIFVSLASADVWAAPTRWRLGPDRRPTVVSGVPPDAFSAEGQLWGHPLYDEAVHAAEGWQWWVARLRRVLGWVDRVRIDHFRGFEAVWEIPADAGDARAGRWVPGAGAGLLDALREAFPSMPFVAEDLGVITDDVRALRDRYALPGMVILQFAFSGAPASSGGERLRHHHPYLPHNHRPNQVCFTGTHDNDTIRGWYASADEGTRDHARGYLAVPDAEVPWAMLRAAWRSACDTAIVPLQDLLGRGGEARFNVPGRTEGNWSWRVDEDPLPLELARAFAREATLSGRDRAPRVGYPETWEAG